MIRAALALCVLAGPLSAESVVAARTIPPHTVIGPDDVLLRDLVVPGSVQSIADIVGLESRVALYAGRPIRPGDVGFPSVVDRNQIIPLIYQGSGVLISTEGRALDRAGPGDLIRVMNMTSRATVTARIGIDGAAYVNQ